MATFYDSLRSHAESTPNALAVIENQRGRWVPLSWSDLLARVDQSAYSLSDASDAKAVVNALPQGLSWLVIDLATQALGRIAVSPASPDPAAVVGSLDNDSVIVARDVVEATSLAGLAAGRAGVLDSNDLSEGESGRELAAQTCRIGLPGLSNSVRVEDMEWVRGLVRSAVSQMGLGPDDVAVVAGPCGEIPTRILTVYAAIESGAVLAFPERPESTILSLKQVRPSFGFLPLPVVDEIEAVLRDRVARSRGVKRMLTSAWVRRGGTVTRLVVARPARRLLGLSGARHLLIQDAQVPHLDKLGAAIRLVDDYLTGLNGPDERSDVFDSPVSETSPEAAQ